MSTFNTDTPTAVPGMSSYLGTAITKKGTVRLSLRRPSVAENDTTPGLSLHCDGVKAELGSSDLMHLRGQRVEGTGKGDSRLYLTFPEQQHTFSGWKSQRFFFGKDTEGMEAKSENSISVDHAIAFAKRDDATIQGNRPSMYTAYIFSLQPERTYEPYFTHVLDVSISPVTRQGLVLVAVNDQTTPFSTAQRLEAAVCPTLGISDKSEDGRITVFSAKPDERSMLDGCHHSQVEGHSVTGSVTEYTITSPPSATPTAASE